MYYPKIFPGEGKKVTLFFAILFVIFLGFSIGWVAIHTIFVKRVGIQFLPYSYIAMSIFGVLGTLGYLFFADRLSRSFLFKASAISLFCILLVARLFLEGHPIEQEGVSFDLLVFASLLFFAQSMCLITLPMQTWTMIGEVFTPNEGKRLYPLFGISTLLGGGSGGSLVPLITDWIGVPNLLLAWGALLLLLVPLGSLYARLIESTSRPLAHPEEITSYVDHLREGFAYSKQSSIVRLIVGVAFSFCILNAWQDFQFTQIMNQEFDSEKALASFYGYYWLMFNSSAVILQLFLTEQIIRSVGLIRSLMILPAVLLINLSFLVIHAGFWEGLWMRFSWDMIGMAVQATAYQLSLSMIPSLVQGRARGWVEGVINPLGQVSAGLLLLLSQLVVGSSEQQLWEAIQFYALTGMLFSACWISWIMWHRRPFFGEVKNNMTRGDFSSLILAIESLEERGDAFCYQTLVETVYQKNLLENRAQAKKLKICAIETLSRLGKPESIPVFFPLLRDTFASIRLCVLRALKGFHRHIKGPIVGEYLQNVLVEMFLHDKNFRVRCEAGRFLVREFGGTRVFDLSKSYLEGEVVDKLMMIRVISRIDLEFCQVLIQKLLYDKNPQVQSEVVVVLWPVLENHFEAKQVLEQLVYSSNKEQVRFGCIALLRLKTCASEFDLSGIQTDDDPHLKTLKGILELSTLATGSPEWEQTFACVFSTLCCSEYDDFDRLEFVRICAHLRCRFTTALIRRILEERHTHPERVAPLISSFQDFSQVILASGDEDYEE